MRSSSLLDKARDARLEQALAELGGREQPPDIAGRLRRCGWQPRPVGAAADLEIDVGSEHPDGPSHAWRAAAVLFGLGITLGVIALGGGRSGDPDPEPATEAPQVPQQPKPVEVRNEHEIRNLDPGVRAVIGRNLSDAQLAELRRCPELQVLHLAYGFGLFRLTSDPRLSDAAFASLGRLTKLRHLSIHDGGKLTGSGLAELGKLPLLRKLELRGTGITADSLRHLRGIPSLTELTLQEKSLDDAALGHIGQLHSLQKLKIEGDHAFTTHGLRQLCGLSAMTDLDLAGFTKTPGEFLDGDVRALAKCRRMWRLSLRGMKSLTNLDFIRGMPKLAHLDITGCSGLPADAFRVLPQSLRLLEAGGTRITAASLGKLSQLEVINLSGCAELTDHDLGSLLGARNLAELAISSCPNLTGRALDIAGKFPLLRYVTLADNPWLRDEHLAALAPLTRLKHLRLGGDTMISDRGLAHLTNLAVLKYLDLTGNKRITAAGLAPLGKLPLANIKLLETRLRDFEVHPVLIEHFGPGQTVTTNEGMFDRSASPMKKR